MTAVVRFRRKQSSLLSEPLTRENPQAKLGVFNRVADIGLHWNQIVKDLLEIKDIFEDEYA